ncbi:conjugal transfer protein TraO [Pseudomonas sp. AB6]|uniref:conjugal transfer protein TraO n=1 Tax=Pseudomonas sp. AB6 TaxID=3048598 RepID=UPI002AB5D826|nr:conjugal transfer protein TraO [Pseudomonas sp. AB6]MDY7563412.1 conjugal transfer protein TraO [Pseudomonas sp. AB6]MEB0213359.1 conjugal transfer protein TraO [Pseudomonas sp. AB6]
MANKNDAGRDIKLTITLVIGVVVAIAGGAYFLWSWLSAAPPEKSQLDINRVTAGSHGSSKETPEYRELLKKYNQQGGNAAQLQNSSFIASIPMEQEPVVLPVSTAKPTAPTQSTARQSRTDQSQASANTGKEDERRQKALDDLLKRIKPPAEAKEHLEGLQVAQVLGSGSGLGGEGGKAGSDYQKWSETLPGGARVQASISTANARTASMVGAPVEVIPPYWRGPGTIDIGVDSDNSTTPVLGKLPTGPYAGAVLKATDGAKLAGEGVVIHFSEMALNGINYKVDAYALKDDTLLANVATDVNHRYMSRIVVPALLSGIGGVGQMYSQANTQVVSNGFTTQTVRPGLPDGTAVVGAIAGGTASQASKVLSEDAARIPAEQVTITKGQVVAIQFMRGVYSGDAIAPGQGGEAIRQSVPVQASRVALIQPTTQDQWRAQTQARIEQQRQLQENK